MEAQARGGQTDTVVANISAVSLRYGATLALDAIDLQLPAGKMVGFIGPDGVGKSSLLSLIAGSRQLQEGSVWVLGGDMRAKKHRQRVCPNIAYMPQGLGKNLYHSLSVEENLQFFSRLFGHNAAERRRRIDDLTQSTGLYKFLDRPAGKLSGGMKQKLSLCCALIHDPDLLILDEPTTGVDPLARAQFWDLIQRIRVDRPHMSVMVATAYMDEAQTFDWLVMMDAGKVLATGTPEELLCAVACSDLESAYIQLLPAEKKQNHQAIHIPPLQVDENEAYAIEAQDLTIRFGDFTAVDHVNFKIRRGEIFGFLGSNGCGKSTTMKILTGLLPATEGKAWLFGQEVNSGNIETRRKVGYMSQAFSLYTELTVLQNLVLHARLYHVPEGELDARVAAMMQRFELVEIQNALPDALPLGVRQRLSLAVALVHNPEILILDEPTSGVDPVSRDNFWHYLIQLSRQDKVTIFISTHFMNEAERCDRMSMMHAGKVLDSDAPAALVAKRQASSLEDAFIGYLLEAGAGTDVPANTVDTATASPQTHADTTPVALDTDTAQMPQPHLQAAYRPNRFSLQRLLSYSWCEALDLKRDRIRAIMALLGSIILMLVMGYGISMDVEDLSYAVLDRDQSTLSSNYALSLSGSPYFIEKTMLHNEAEMDRRLQNGELALAIEIPPNFAQKTGSGQPVAVAAWIDGAMPSRAETVQGYVQAIHQTWLAEQIKAKIGASLGSAVTVETRYRYNPDVKSLPAMVPAVMPLLLLMLPAILTALSVVREKENGSIINLYVTPVSKAEFLLGKQMPYIALGFVNYLLMTLLAVTLFGVPIKGSFLTLSVAALLYVIIATGMGLLASTLTKSQIAAMFFTLIGTITPAIQFSGMLNPVSSMQGFGRLFGEVYPATAMINISRGVFNKALGFADLHHNLWLLALTIPVVLGVAIVLLKKQER